MKINPDQDDPPSTAMEHLPHEIIHDILSRLPISSLVQFKCVCKAWRALAQDPHLVRFYLSTTTNNDPCLILHCDFPIRNQIYFVDFAAAPDQGKDKVKKNQCTLLAYDARIRCGRFL